MSLSLSPSIVTNGLVFAYDQNNIKSYKGPVLQNVANAISLAGVGTSTGYVSTALTETVDISGLGLTTVYTNIIQNNYTSHTPNSANCCPSLHSWGYIAVSPSTLYTYGIVYKCDSGYTGPNYMYRYEYTSNGGAYVTEGGVHSDANRVSLGNGWYYAWGTFTTSATTNWLGHCGTFYYRYSPYIDKLSVAKVLIAAGNWSNTHPKYWPGSNTTRSNTQAMLDLTNNNTITANSLTYASDGTFSFDGSYSYLQSQTNCGITGGVTLSAWIKPSRVGQTGPHSTVICTDVNYPYGAKLMNYKNNSRYGIWVAFGPTVSYEALIAGDINDNTNKMLTASWDQTTGNAKIYLNGVLQSTIATGYTTPMVLFDGKITVGTDYNNIGSGTLNKYLGNIYNASVYNRVLSDTEVLQNFNATRGRYFGYQKLFYTASSNVTLTNNGTEDVSMFKTSDNGSWNGEVRSTESFSAPCTIEFSKQAASGDNGVSYAMIGWNEDPTLNTSYDSIDHAAYPYRSDIYSVYNNGSQVNFSGAWDVNKRFYIVYGTDGFIRHYNGSTLLYSANYGTNKTVYVDSSLYSVNSTFGGFSNVKVTRSAWNGSNYV